MGKKSKIGKQRRDRYYHLARETGYRSRAAFKLIQLNRKFEFLQKARVLVDLCAAPGGWMQVAKENMPVSSVVIGVDMFPMKPLPGCIFLQEDITTDKCRVSLQRELKTWKADVILNDGAPNVGKNWLHDSYNQVCLTLSALKLATQFLREGGYFVTKVFRSKDYNALLWVLKQLFKKVHSTKPQASRSESAEIFIVCQHYLAPSKLDNKFLDPNYVFKDLETSKKIPLLTDKIKKPKAEGYPDDPSILHAKLLASAFINSENAIAALQNASEIVLDDDKIRDHPATTNELKSCFEDIKILGRKDLRNILNWWKALRKEKEESKKKEEQEEKKEEVQVEAKDESDEEKQLDDVDMEIKKLEDEERRESKRKRKKVEKERTKLQMKMTLKMKHENDLGPTEQTDREMFQLSKIASKNELHKVSEEKPETLADSDEEVHEKQPTKVKFNTETSYLDSSGMFYRNEDDSEEEGEPEEEEEFESDRESLGLSGDEEEKESKKDQSRNKKRVSFADTVQTNPLLVDLDSRSIRDRRLAKAQLWFDKDIFKDAENESDEDYELDKITTVIKDMGGKLMTNDRDVNGRENEIEEGDSSEDDEEDSESELESEIENEINVKEGETTNANLNEWDVDEETTSGKKKRKREKRTLDDKGLALGSMMATSKKMKRDILDSGWNRFAFNDENLPSWFVENEAKYMRKQIPVPKELVDEYQKRKEELNVRPIKKVIEAKARKKKRTMRKMEKAKKKLEGLMENPDVTDAEKARQVKTIYKKLKSKKPNVKYVVAKKHTTAKRIARPRGVKGQYKVVDPRMKKEMRAKVKHATKNKSKKASNKIRRSMKPRNHKRK